MRRSCERDFGRTPALSPGEARRARFTLVFAPCSTCSRNSHQPRAPLWRCTPPAPITLHCQLILSFSPACPLQTSSVPRNLEVSEWWKRLISRGQAKQAFVIRGESFGLGYLSNRGAWLPPLLLSRGKEREGPDSLSSATDDDREDAALPRSNSQSHRRRKPSQFCA